MKKAKYVKTFEESLDLKYGKLGTPKRDDFEKKAKSFIDEKSIKEEIDKEYLLTLNYPTHLWMEKEIKSVANVAESDVSEFLKLAAEMAIKPEVQEYALEDANQALVELKERKIRGAKVLRID